MSKTLETKKVNRYIKKLNHSLQEDVFKDRFYIYQIQKSSANGVEYFRFKLTDKEQSERNYETHWFTSFEICKLNNMFWEINDFIIKSNFWSKHNNK